MKGFPQIRPITNKAEHDRLVAEARADSHNPVLPTHIFWKNDQIVGYASVCALVPLIAGAVPQVVQFHTWFHTQRLSPRDSFTLINMLENIMASGCQAHTCLVPVSKDSPFDSVMESMGYTELMDTRLWSKTIRPV